MNRLFIALIAIAALSGCAQKPIIKVETVEVLVPVRLPCSVEEPGEPFWNVPGVPRDATIFEQMRALLADRALAFGYQNELKTALGACKQ
jgi:hypothetical protein